MDFCAWPQCVLVRDEWGWHEEPAAFVVFMKHFILVLISHCLFSKSTFKMAYLGFLFIRTWDIDKYRPCGSEKEAIWKRTRPSLATIYRLFSRHLSRNAPKTCASTIATYYIYCYVTFLVWIIFILRFSLLELFWWPMQNKNYHSAVNSLTVSSSSK